MLTMELDILTQARRLHARGLAVFPVDITTKQPLIEWGGFDAVVPTEEQVTTWFGGEPCAVGIACGPVSEILLLDFDFKHPEAREFYEKNRHRLPRTWKEETASGGLHLYFRWANALDLKQTNTTSRLYRGVDTKGFGGYSKITPSPGYKWLIPPHLAPLAMCPQWLIDALPNKDKREIADAFKQKPDDWMIKELANVDPADPINGRTPTFVRAIGRLKAKGLNEVEVASLLQPWADKYSYPRLESLVADQFRRYPPRPETQTPNVSNHSFKSFMSTKRKIPFIVPGFFGYNTINVIAGLQESRKSWLLLDLAVALASGTPWLGKWPCARLKTIILDQERPSEEMQRRLDALIAGRGLKEDDMEGFLIPKAGLEPPFKLNLDPSFQAFEKMIDEVRPEVVIVDSLKTIQSGDINSNADMQRLFERVKMLRLKYKTAFVILHHENKGTYSAIREKHIVTAENIEGSGVINQVPEGLFIARNFDGDSTMLHHVKNSYGVKVPPFLVKVRDVATDRSKIVVEAF